MRIHFEAPGHDFHRIKREPRPLVGVKILSKQETLEMARKALMESKRQELLETERLRQADARAHNRRN